jgi:hypothetical protein
MDAFSKTEAGKRFKKFADTFYDRRKKELSELLGLANQTQLADYFNGKAILGNEKLSIISSLGFNIEYYLSGVGTLANASIVKEKKETYGNQKSEEVVKLEHRVQELKAENYDLLKQLDEAKKKIYEYESNKH